MGLDISFNKQEAIDAGLQLSKGDQRGTTADITEALEDGRIDYANYLSESVVLAAVPNTDHWVEVDTFEGRLSCRANKWGRTYGPLTSWLKEHGIKWSEF